MSEPARLHLVDGEIPADGPQTFGQALAEIERLEGIAKGHERDIRGWIARYNNLKRDKEEEARQSEFWEAGEEVFAYWKLRCNHPNSKFGWERFEIVLSYLKKYGPELCRRAIDGAAFDPFVTSRKNGSRKRHDGWDLIFRNPDKFEEFVNRAPRDAGLGTASAGATSPSAPASSAESGVEGRAA